MLTRFARRLVLSAAGRDLAIDLVARHGGDALAIVNERLRACCDAGEEAMLLTIARREIVALVPLLSEARPARDGISARLDRPATA